MNTSYYGYPVFTEAVHRKDKLCALPGHEEIQYRVVQIEERVVGNC